MGAVLDEVVEPSPAKAGDHTWLRRSAPETDVIQLQANPLGLPGGDCRANSTMSPVSRSSLSRPRGIFRCVERCCGPRKSTALLEHARCRRGDERGLVVSPDRLLQDQLVQDQIRHPSAEPGVLRLEILQALDLVA